MTQRRYITPYSPYVISVVDLTQLLPQLGLSGVIVQKKKKKKIEKKNTNTIMAIFIRAPYGVLGKSSKFFFSKMTIDLDTL